MLSSAVFTVQFLAETWPCPSTVSQRTCTLASSHLLVGLGDGILVVFIRLLFYQTSIVAHCQLRGVCCCSVSKYLDT